MDRRDFCCGFDFRQSDRAVGPERDIFGDYSPEKERLLIDDGDFTAKIYTRNSRQFDVV